MIGHVDHEDVIERVVAGLYQRYHDYVERDDLRQEAMLWWYGPGQQYLPEYVKDEEHGRLRKALWRWCARYAETEEAHARGYEAGDRYRYSPAEVVRLLPYCLDADGLPSTGTPEGGKAPKGNLAEGGDLLAAWVDVRRALEQLDDDDYLFLTVVDDLSQDWERIASYTGTLADSARRRHTRIAERMVRWLNTKENVA